MPINNLLFVDDDPVWLRLGQRRFQALTPNVDVAKDYDSAIRKIRKTTYDLIILDSLEGDCFRIHQDAKDLPHGDVVIFSANMLIQSHAERLGIPFYSKLNNDLDKIIRTYKK